MKPVLWKNIAINPEAWYRIVQNGPTAYLATKAGQETWYDRAAEAAALTRREKHRYVAPEHRSPYRFGHSRSFC